MYIYFDLIYYIRGMELFSRVRVWYMRGGVAGDIFLPARGAFIYRTYIYYMRKVAAAALSGIIELSCSCLSLFFRVF